MVWKTGGRLGVEEEGAAMLCRRLVKPRAGRKVDDPWQ